MNLSTLASWITGLLLGSGTINLKELGVKEIMEQADVDAIIAASQSSPQFIFKHSTACPVSSAAHRRVSDYLTQHPDQAAAFHLIKVIERRPVSLALASQLGVVHQSPQIILLHQGAAVWNTSHGNITADSIKQALANL
ncbi:MAG: bacillithiol system redox-active protein YtxJ [Candidatus Hydrogenedentota bacterium]|jgi:bacillithiol system protein YtxJ